MGVHLSQPRRPDPECPICGGSGKVLWRDPGRETLRLCPECGGLGVLRLPEVIPDPDPAA